MRSILLRIYGWIYTFLCFNNPQSITFVEDDGNDYPRSVSFDVYLTFLKNREIFLRDDRKLVHRPKVATLSGFYAGEQLRIIETQKWLQF